MPTSLTAPDDSQRRAARILGFAFLFAMAVVVAANYGINFRLIVAGNAVDTARNITAHETLFRLNIVANLVYALLVVLQLAALYVILKPANKNLALAAAFARLIFALTWGATAISTLGALRLLGDSPYLSVFATAQLQALARLNLASSFDAYYVGLPFWGVAATICSYLWLKSGYIPRGLALFGLISSAWCVICAFTFLVFPHFDKTVNSYWFDSPMALSELALGLWLLVKGLR